MIRAALFGLIGTMALLPTAQAQSGSVPQAPVVDTIVVVTRNVFGQEESRANFAFRLANALRVKTRPFVVRRELLFRVGEPYDSSLVAETQRNLRALGIFRDVAIDTVRVAGRLAVVVTTADGWSTQLQISMRFTAGTFSWSGGVIEQNFLGTASRAGVVYRDEPDRTAFTFLGATDRVFGTRMTLQGLYDDLSDGTRGGWNLGVPFRASLDRSAFGLPGYAGDERVLQYRDGAVAETYQRRSFIQSAHIAFAPVAGTRTYLRVGAIGLVRREEFILRTDTPLAIPDTVTGAVGVFGELSRLRFKVITHYNGFARDQDLDLSDRISVSAWVAPGFWGYPETGVGLGLGFQTGVSLGPNFMKLNASANGLFNSAGLDSGQVWVGATVASRFIPRSATVVHVEAAARKRAPPGAEYDLGHGSGPRVFGPHAFTGDRMLWLAAEHRAFLVDEIAGLFGVGLAAFVDYGGAWYDDQPRRLGGDVGFGLRIGSTRSSGQNVGRVDLGYRFGEGFDGGRWAMSFGQGFAF
jgi:hypothetical protein